MANQVTLLNPASLIAKYNVHPKAPKIVNEDFFKTACKLVNETFVTDGTEILSWSKGEILSMVYYELSADEARIILLEMPKPTHITVNEWDDFKAGLVPSFNDPCYHLAALLLLEQYSYDNVTTWIEPNRGVHKVQAESGMMTTVGKLSSLALIEESYMSALTAPSQFIPAHDHCVDGVEFRWAPESREFAAFYRGTFHCRLSYDLDLSPFDEGDDMHVIEIAMTDKSKLLESALDMAAFMVRDRADRLMPYIAPVEVESLSLSDMWKAAHEAIEGAITFAHGTYDFGPYSVQYTDLNHADDKALTVRINGILVGTFGVGALCDMAVYTSMSLWQSGSDEMPYILPMFINKAPADVIKTCLKGVLRRYAHDTNLMSDQQFENVIDPIIIGREPREDVAPLTVTAVQGHLFDF